LNINSFLQVSIKFQLLNETGKQINFIHTEDKKKTCRYNGCYFSI